MNTIGIFSAALALAAAGSLLADSANGLFEVSNSEQLVKAVQDMPPTGGAIRLAPGSYKVSKTLVIKGKSNVNISGSGWCTTITKEGGGDCLLFDNSHFCTVKDVLLLGDPKGPGGSGIVFRNGSSCTVDMCRIVDFAVSGVSFEGDPKSPMSSNTVSRCHFIGNRKGQLNSFNNNDFYIWGNQFGTHSAFPEAGCILDHSSAGTYTMNYHWGNVNALVMRSSQFNRLENNRFEQSRETGIVIGTPDPASGSSYNIITGNTIHTNSEGNSGKFPAVQAYNSAYTNFTNNQIFSWDSNSVKFKECLVLGPGCVHWIVTGCAFHHSTGEALVYDKDAGHIIKDNK